MVERPLENEHSRYFAKYISLAEDGDALHLLSVNRAAVSRLFASLTEEQQQYRYAPDKWTPKDVLCHIIDTERGMCYRALCISRGDTQNLPYMDEDLFATNGRANDRTMNSLVAEYHAVRESTLMLFSEAIPHDRLSVVGMVNSNPMSARALAWIIAGHEIHHVMILRDRYAIAYESSIMK